MEMVTLEFHVPDGNVQKLNASKKCCAPANAQGPRPWARPVSSSLVSSQHECDIYETTGKTGQLTSLSKTHLFSLRSSDRQLKSCWLWFSRHCQWVRNSAKQWSFKSLILAHRQPFPSFSSIPHPHHPPRTHSRHSASPCGPPSCSRTRRGRWPRSYTSCSHRCRPCTGHR